MIYLSHTANSIRSRPRTQFSCSQVHAVSLTPSHLNSAGTYCRYTMCKAFKWVPQVIRREDLSCKKYDGLFHYAFNFRVFEGVTRNYFTNLERLKYC